MASMTKKQINAYEKAWRKERERIRKFASTLRKRGYILAEDFVPPIKPTRRTKAALKKITEFRGREYYSKAAYPTKTGEIARGYSSKAAYKEDLKAQKKEQAGKRKGFSPDLPKGNRVGKDKDYIVTDTGTVVDRRKGEVADGLMYDEEKRKILDTNSGEEFDGYLKQGDMVIDTETGEVKDIDTIEADTLKNIKQSINTLFDSVRDTIGNTDWDLIQAKASRKYRSDINLSEKIEQIQNVINETINKIDNTEEGEKYYDYLVSNIEAIYEAIQDAAAYSDNDGGRAKLDRAINLITQNDSLQFDSESFSDYGVVEDE